MKFTHFDLFAGLGGFSRAVQWLDGTTVGFVEWDSWCRRVLVKHWPEARYFGDITTVGTSDIAGLGHIDLITGGYPCQPFSHAGKRLGDKDDRHLWPEMRRIIDVARPSYVLAENVAGHINMGLDLVLSQLEEDGYTCRAVVVPAAAVNALHRRDRVWIMAHRNGSESTERRECAGAASESGERRSERSGGHGDARQISVRCAGEHPGEVMANAGQGDGGRWPNAAGGDDRNGHDAEWQETPGGIDERSEGMANPAARGIRRGSAPRESGQPAFSSEGVADTEASGRYPSRRDEAETGTDRTLDACCSEPTVANASVSGHKSQRRCVEPIRVSTSIRRDRCAESGEPTERQAPRSLDAGAHGIPAGLVRRPATGPVVRPRVVGGSAPAACPSSQSGHPTEYGRDRSAQGVAPAQHVPLADPDMIRQAWADASWERDLPRVVATEVERRQKLQAAGNAIVPIVAYEILSVMLEGEVS